MDRLVHRSADSDTHSYAHKSSRSRREVEETPKTEWPSNIRDSAASHDALESIEARELEPKYVIFSSSTVEIRYARCCDNYDLRGTRTYGLPHAEMHMSVFAPVPHLPI